MKFRRALIRIGDIGKRHQQINVALGIGIASRDRTEQDDLVRGEPLCDTLNQSVRNFGGGNNAHNI
jgi:hypothetical protein